MKKATFDPAKNLNLYFRKRRNGSKVLAFFNADGSDYDVSAINFEIAGIDATLSASGNELTITKTTDIAASQAFWELINATDNKTWLCGTAFYREGLSDEAEDSTDLTITLNGEVVNIEIVAGASAGVNGGTP